MSIGAIGQYGNFANASVQYSSSAHKSASVKVASAKLKKDTAILSESAKDLAALKAGKSSQEEAAESISTEQKEQFSGVG